MRPCKTLCSERWLGACSGVEGAARCLLSPPRVVISHLGVSFPPRVLFPATFNLFGASFLCTQMPFSTFCGSSVLIPGDAGMLVGPSQFGPLPSPWQAESG